MKSIFKNYKCANKWRPSTVGHLWIFTDCRLVYQERWIWWMVWILMD